MTRSVSFLGSKELRYHILLCLSSEKKKLANDREIVRSDLLDEDACEADKGAGEGMPP